MDNNTPAPHGHAGGVDGGRRPAHTCFWARRASLRSRSSPKPAGAPNSRSSTSRSPALCLGPLRALARWHGDRALRRCPRHLLRKVPWGGDGGGDGGGEYGGGEYGADGGGAVVGVAATTVATERVLVVAMVFEGFPVTHPQCPRTRPSRPIPLAPLAYPRLRGPRTLTRIRGRDSDREGG